MYLKILLVEDFKEYRETAETGLTQLGHTVVLASTFTNAIWNLERYAFDLVICDLHAEGSLRDVVRLAKRNPLTKVLLWSGDLVQILQRYTRITGADGYSQKVRGREDQVMEYLLASIEELFENDERRFG